jgi:mycofactocin glycosyltransferase
MNPVPSFNAAPDPAFPRADARERRGGAPPGDFCLALDVDARIAGDGSTIGGGSPPRLLRLTAAGARILNEIASGASVADMERRRPGAGLLARRLIAAGLAHPIPPLRPLDDAVEAVIPVRNRTERLPALIGALRLALPAIVVDDASDDDTAAIGRTLGCIVVTLHRRVGPAGARNAGWRKAEAPFIAFIDSDCRPGPGTLERLVAHLADSSVGAAAPRIRPTPEAAAGVVGRYEARRSSEDMGARPAQVRPLSRVAYAPTVLLMARRAALTEIGGFDESMFFGEDVDLVWRLVAAGWEVRYDPAVQAFHDHRRSLPAFLLRKFAYGSAAAALERRHPGRMERVRVSAPDAAAWALAAVQPVLGLAALAMITIASRWRHAGRPTPSVPATLAHVLESGGKLVDSIVRTWLPAAFAVGVLSPRFAVMLALGVIASGLADRRRGECGLNAYSYVAIRLLDDASYSFGVWWGCLRHRSIAPLIPKFTLSADAARR